ncbi:CerR family C-terminal domain-containing protein [Caulobacter mirabilis]|uniref:TetR family transcriptional regulator n=1 Tax=Caulobacter mirabilis TaxID=69666 RepID=A0A2D2B1B6_9CAUL|nr:CerR family C-terminal domain-containing protein [Caulobacter mirabilis]ATQ44028.1 TetR family transcriptional regulator [Caulobacter mirabilis]
MQNPAPSAARTPPVGGYRKGDEARQRILDAALAAFGAEGFRGATTRRIAEAAGVNLPALQYYFGGKEGLYLACAEEIVDRYRRQMLRPIGAAQDALPPTAGPEDARTALKALLGGLAEQLLATEEAQAWTAFVLREVAEQGPAFAILYEQVWAPGVELITQLISRALAEPTPSEAARIEALLLLSGLSAFSVARPVALKQLGWSDSAGLRFDRVKRTLDAQIDRLGR